MEARVRSRSARATVTVHAAVLLFGLAGVLGKMTSLPATNIVLGRVVFAGLALAGLLGLRRAPLRPRGPGDALALGVSGVILAAHWTAFFQSVRVSNVAVALLSFSTFPLFTTALEPLLLRDRPRRVDVLAALLVVPGMYFVVPSLSLSNSATVGAAWGVLAGFTFALLSIWNRRLTRRYPSMVISLYQDGVAALVLLPTLLVARPAQGLSGHDLAVLLALGVICTALAHTLFIDGMRTLTAQTASVIAALEPVWGILFALLLLGEVPSWRVLIGGTLIVGATLLPALVRAPAPPSGLDVPAAGPAPAVMPEARSE
jgi:drug/metabolite transporter (DMT)-like permease